MRRLLVIGCLCFVLGCSDQDAPEQGKHKVYVYKQLEPDGLLCVFYSASPENAERNARMYVEMNREKYGQELTATPTPISR